MVLKIDGVDILPFIKEDGIQWKRSDLDSPDSGRTLDGVMHRGRVGTKIRLDISCKYLSDTDTHTILNLIYPEYVTVEYEDPLLGLRTCTMYSNNNPAVLKRVDNDGTPVWHGIEFPLIEV